MWQAFQQSSETVETCDSVCAPLLRKICELNHALSCWCAPTSSEGSILTGSLVDHQGDRSNLAAAVATMSSGLENPDRVTSLPPCVPSLSVQQARLLSGAGVWQSIIAMLCAPHVRQSRCRALISYQVHHSRPIATPSHVRAQIWPADYIVHARVSPF